MACVYKFYLDMYDDDLNLSECYTNNYKIMQTILEIVYKTVIRSTIKYLTGTQLQLAHACTVLAPPNEHDR